MSSASGDDSGVRPSGDAPPGLRKISGRHLTVWTDLPVDDEVEALPGIFAQAIPQWCKYFGVDVDRLRDWRMTAYLMNDADRFRLAGLLPQDAPVFRNGYCAGDVIWLYEQPSAYYRRHLLLHEGTHGFMMRWLGGMGPPWLMEGLAELAATHRVTDQEPQLFEFPDDRDQVPMWGRIRLIKDAVERDGSLSVAEVMQTRSRDFLDDTAYAWCWGLCAFLNSDPAYRTRFAELARTAAEPDFNVRLKAALTGELAQLETRWQWFVHRLDYGYDFQRAAIDLAPGDRNVIKSDERSVAVDVGRGWQNTQLAVEGGETYELSAAGRFQVDDEPQIWWSEPGGVSIRYWRGRPIGQLLAAVHDIDVADGLSEMNGELGLLNPVSIGLKATVTPETDGVLFLRVNDSPAELGDNRGTVDVRIRASSD